MDAELATKLLGLRTAAAALNKASDEAAVTMREVDLFLQGISLGVTAEAHFDGRVVFLEGGPPGGTQVEFYLCYGRLADKFRVHVSEWSSEVPEQAVNGLHDWTTGNVRQVEWSSCSRELKVRSFAVLPDLIEELLGNTRALVETAEKGNDRVAILRDLLDSYKKSGI